MGENGSTIVKESVLIKHMDKTRQFNFVPYNGLITEFVTGNFEFDGFNQT